MEQKISDYPAPEQIQPLRRFLDENKGRISNNRLTIMHDLFKQCRGNLYAIIEDACTEPTEAVVGIFYFWWALTIDITASSYYKWMINGAIAWRILAATLGTLRILSTLLGGKVGRYWAGLLIATYSLTLAIGFGLSGWVSASGSHGFFALYAAWCVYRVRRRIHGPFTANDHGERMGYEVVTKEPLP